MVSGVWHQAIYIFQDSHGSGGSFLNGFRGRPQLLLIAYIHSSRVLSPSKCSIPQSSSFSSLTQTNRHRHCTSLPYFFPFFPFFSFFFLLSILSVHSLYRSFLISSEQSNFGFLTQFYRYVYIWQLVMGWWATWLLSSSLVSSNLAELAVH